MADNRYQIEFIDGEQGRSINLSKCEAAAYFPTVVNLLENSDCNICDFEDEYGKVTISKTEEDDEIGR